MIRKITIKVMPEHISDIQYIRNKAIKEAGINPNELTYFSILKKSMDARQRPVIYQLKTLIVANEPQYKPEEFNPDYKNVEHKPSVIIVGAGPAGLFAALALLQKGLKPVILERGKDVSARKRDVALISRGIELPVDSNYCFGEGGAGTFSDGKLYTRSKKRGNVDFVLNTLVYHGADPAILYEAHPHIGTDKLPGIIFGIRKSIVDHGGEFYFQKKLTDFKIKNGRFKSALCSDGDQFEGIALILATGHSARDVYEMLYEKKITLKEKGFAMGVRVEHPQELIDRIQYKTNDRGKHLPAASYSLSKQIDGRGVYSFCMCPGGYVVPAQTAEGVTVVNGMSPSKRNSAFANSGIVVEIRPEDISDRDKHGALAGLKFQENLEKIAFINGGSGLTAPAQKLTDFVKRKFTSDIPYYSYFPGIVPSPVHFWLPAMLYNRLSKGFIEFNKSMKGFLTKEAVVYGVESRTSSPVQILRDQQSLEHPQVGDLYPCGEGAGYAGGIVSSAMDGILVAGKIAEKEKQTGK